MHHGDWWVDFGSLLGIHRDGDLIPYDNDVDICLLSPQWDDLYVYLTENLNQYGYGVRWTVPSENKTVRWLRVIHGACMIDVYGAYRPGCTMDGALPLLSHTIFGISATSSMSEGSQRDEDNLDPDPDDPCIHIELGHGSECDVPEPFILPTGRIIFRGVELRVPKRLECVLEHRYGATWRTPIYMDKGRDTIESSKLYARVLRVLGKIGLKF